MQLHLSSVVSALIQKLHWTEGLHRGTLTLRWHKGKGDESQRRVWKARVSFMQIYIFLVLTGVSAFYFQHGFIYFKIFYWSIVGLRCSVHFCCTAKWVSYMYAYTHSFKDSFPMYVITEYWVRFSVIHSRSLFAVVQLLSHVQLFGTPWIAALQASLSFTISQSLLKLMSSELVMSSNHLILCCPLLLLP